MLLWRCLLEVGDLPAGIFLLLAALIVLVAFANDDDLPGPRRCFASAAGPSPRAFGVEG